MAVVKGEGGSDKGSLWADMGWQVDATKVTPCSVACAIRDLALGKAQAQAAAAAAIRYGDRRPAPRGDAGLAGRADS